MKKSSVLITLLFLLFAPSVFAQTACGDIITSDLTLTNDVSECNSGNGLILNAPDITLDCNGYSIHSAAHNNNGILLGSEASGVTIKNCEVINFNTGINGKACTNLSDVVVQDTFVNNNTIGIDFYNPFGQCGGIKSYFKNLTFTNVNFSVISYALDIDVDVCNFNNMYFTCNGDVTNGDCEATVYFDNIRACNIDGWRTTNAFDMGIVIEGQGGGGNLRADNNVFNNVFLNVTNGGSWGIPYGFWMQKSDNLTITNSIIVTDDEANLVAITHESDVAETTVISTSYPYGKEEINTGNLLRYWRTNITTNVDDVDVTATSKLNVSITGTTSSVLTFTLLGYRHDSTGIVNSTPYTTDVVIANESFQKSLAIGDDETNSISFLKFTDSDKDAIHESIDNCLTKSNHDQLDTDKDSGGDVCDICPKDSKDACDVTESGSETINETGGTVDVSSGNAEVIIPAESLKEDTSVSISGSNETPTTNVSSFQVQTGGSALSLIYSFEPEGTEFNTAVTITLKYDDTGIKDESAVDIYFFNATTELWEPQGAKCNAILNECVLTVNHFSDFILGVLINPDEDGDGIDDIIDMCPGSVMDGIINTDPNHYAQNLDFGAFEVGPDNHQSEVYDMLTTRGCTCKQIAKQLGIGKGRFLGKGYLKKGCSSGIMKQWTGISFQLDRHYWKYWEN